MTAPNSQKPHFDEEEYTSPPQSRSAVMNMSSTAMNPTQKRPADDDPCSGAAVKKSNNGTDQPTGPPSTSAVSSPNGTDAANHAATKDSGTASAMAETSVDRFALGDEYRNRRDIDQTALNDKFFAVEKPNRPDLSFEAGITPVVARGSTREIEQLMKTFGGS